MIRKVATIARKAVLLGALVSGVSMVSYATETTETNIGPTKDKVEAAKLQTVQQSLNAVVAAIKKVDPDWVKSLPVMKETTKTGARTAIKKRATLTYGVLDKVDANTYRITPNSLPPNTPHRCGSEDFPCTITFDPEDSEPWVDEDDGNTYVTIHPSMDESGAGPYAP